MQSIFTIGALLCALLAAGPAAAQTSYPGQGDPHPGRLSARRSARYRRAPARRQVRRGLGQGGGDRERDRRRRQRRGRARDQGRARRLHVADGGNRAIVINPSLYDKLPYDAVEGPGADLARGASRRSSSWSTTMCRRAAWASSSRSRARSPARLTFGSAGGGTPAQLAGELFKAMAGIDIAARSLSRQRRRCCRICSPAASPWRFPTPRSCCQLVRERQAARARRHVAAAHGRDARSCRPWSRPDCRASTRAPGTA